MKKLFLIPLLASFACLSAWAATSVSTQTQLQNAINGAPAGSTVDLILGSDITLENQAICIYDRNVIIDLNTHNILTNRNATQIRGCFFLIKGTLELKGTGSVRNSNGSATTNSDWKTAAVQVFGSRTYKNDGTLKDFTHLIIGKTVTVESEFGKGVQIYTYYNNTTFMPADNTKEGAYFYPLFYGGTALAQSELNALRSNATFAGPSSFHGFAFGVTVDVYGTLKGAQYAFQVSGVISGDAGAKNFLNNYPVVRSFTLVDGKYVETFSDNHPYCYIHSGAVVQGVGSEPFETGKYPTGVYLGGYGHLIVEGTVSGANGIFAKAGSVSIDGGTVTANGPDVETTDGGGTMASGNAITSTNQTAYTAVSSVFISGASSITSANGYAFEENNVAESGRNENAANIVVTGGTFQGHTATEGDNESLKTTTDVKEALTGENPEGKIIAGTFTGDEIANLVNFAVESGLVTDPIVVSSQDGYVINTLPQGTEKTTLADDATSFPAESEYVTLPNEELDIVVGNGEIVKMDYLSMTKENPSVVTIEDGGVLEAGAIVLGGANKIIVKAGGKLLVTGLTGVVSFDARNLIIEAEAGKAGIFVFHPDVQSNRSPEATVEYVSTAKSLGGGQYLWDMFVSPFSAITSIENDVPTLFKYVDASGNWVAYQSKDEIYENARPFEAIAITNNQSNASVKYTFQGTLQGNISGKVELKKGFNYIGNAYLAEMNAQKIFDAITSSGADVRTVLYTWDKYQGFVQYNEYKLSELSQMPGMTMFVLYANEDVELDLNYEELVWELNKD